MFQEFDEIKNSYFEKQPVQLNEIKKLFEKYLKMEHTKIIKIKKYSGTYMYNIHFMKRYNDVHTKLKFIYMLCICKA